MTSTCAGTPPLTAIARHFPRLNGDRQPLESPDLAHRLECRARCEVDRSVLDVERALRRREGRLDRSDRIVGVGDITGEDDRRIVAVTGDTVML